MRLQKIVFISFLSLCLCLSGCGLRAAVGVDLEPTPILSGGQGWAIVSNSYIRLKANPSLQAADIADLRDGSEVQILGREIGKDSSDNQAYWYKIEATESGQKTIQGWVLDSEVSVYATKAQADYALKTGSSK